MLSATAVEFLKSIFRHRCTSNNVFPVDLLLQDTGPASLFHNAPLATSADELPLGWANIRQLLVRSADPRYLPLESFLSIWAYCAMMNPRKSVMAMMYLGYPDGYGRCDMTLNSCLSWKLCCTTGISFMADRQAHLTRSSRPGRDMFSARQQHHNYLCLHPGASNLMCSQSHSPSIWAFVLSAACCLAVQDVARVTYWSYFLAAHKEDCSIPIFSKQHG